MSLFGFDLSSLWFYHFSSFPNLMVLDFWIIHCHFWNFLFMIFISSTFFSRFDILKYYLKLPSFNPFLSLVKLPSILLSQSTYHSMFNFFSVPSYFIFFPPKIVTFPNPNIIIAQSLVHNFMSFNVFDYRKLIPLSSIFQFSWFTHHSVYLSLESRLMEGIFKSVYILLPKMIRFPF
jgi:hypothetical protein